MQTVEGLLSKRVCGGYKTHVHNQLEDEADIVWTWSCVKQTNVILMHDWYIDW